MNLLNLSTLRETIAEHKNSPFLKRAKRALTSKRAEEAEAQPSPSLENTCDYLLVLVDRQNTLPENYVPRDLVSLRSYGIPTLGVDMLLRQEAAEHLSQLVAAASAAGEKLIVTSAYRSFQDQQAVFARGAFVYEREAGRHCALPGQSQHQLGTTVDFTSEAANFRLWTPFEDASAARWLLEHASEYGFVLAYPKGGEAETGYEAELWHYRYIGVENGRRLKDNGLSLQAFLLQEGVLPQCTAAEPLETRAPTRSNTLEELRSRLSRISRAHAGTLGVAIFDPYTGETVLLNADRRFIAACLSKLYVLLTLYRAAARGEVDLDDEITMWPSDVWDYGTGVLYKYPVGHTMTLRECAEFMIKEGDTTAEHMLNRYLGIDRIEGELREIGAHSTTYWTPTNTTTPNDVLLALKAIADPSYTTVKLSAEMLDVMTNTSFEDRLPHPLPEGTRVAHEIGSYENTFSDAGIVFPKEQGGTGQAYYIVVFSDGATEGESREIIRYISLEAYQALTRSHAR